MRKIVPFLFVFILSSLLVSAQNLETSFKVKFKNNKILVEDQTPFNLWLINQRDYTFDISDPSLTGQDLSFSFVNDAFQNNQPNISNYYTKTGKEGEANANIKINMAINGMDPMLVVYLYSEKLPATGNKIYFSNHLNDNYTFLNNRMYKQYKVIQSFNTKLGNNLNKNVPFAGNEEIGFYVDLNKDNNLDLIYTTDQLYHKDALFNTGKLMVPIYFTIQHNKEQENPLTINISNEDLSKPNSTPKTLFHNWDAKTEIDLDGDDIKEYLNWGEHYHVGPSPLWKDVATQLGMTSGVDYGPSATLEGATFYDPVFYLRKFRYYKVDSNRMIDKASQIPSYTALTGAFFGAGGDVDKDGDNDIVLKANNGKGKILYNDGKGLFITSIDMDEIPRIYPGEDFNRSDGFHYPYLIDMNNDTYPDWVLTLNAPRPKEPIRVVYYPNNKGIFDIQNPVDIFPKNSSYGKDNLLSYPVIQMKEADLNKDGVKELIFLFGTVSNQDYLNILPRNIFKIISITKTGNIDVTGTYFPNNTNIVETGNAMKGFNIIDVDGDGNLDFLPRFEMYDPKYASWFPAGSWRGYWNNKTSFQYYAFNGTNYEIKSLGKILSLTSNSSNNNSPSGIKEEQTLTNYIEIIDLNNDKVPEYFTTQSGMGSIHKAVNDFTIGNKNIDVKEVATKGTYIGSLKIDGYDTAQIEYSIVNPTTDTSFIIKNNNQIILNQILDRSKKTYHTTFIKFTHKTLNISSYGYVKLNVLADIPEQPKILMINSDTSSNVILCSSLPGSIIIKSDSISKIDKFIFEIATDVNFTTVKTIESVNAQVQYDYTQSNTFYIRVKTTNKNGTSAYSLVKTIRIKQLPSTPVITRDADNNLVSSIATGNLWFKDGVATLEKEQKFKPTTPGNYSVKVTQDGCSSSSNNYYYLITDIYNISATEFIKLAPNPFINQINLDYFIRGYGRLNIEVVSITTGKVMLGLKGIATGTPISLANLSSGVYLVKVSSNDYKFVHQFKMVKM
jgi:hypothetical protein